MHARSTHLLPLLLLAAAGRPEPALARPGPPAAGRPLARFHHALRQAARGQGQARLVVFGASHVASDLMTGHLRRRLQERFGDAGAGFALPVKPWPSYRRAGLRISSSRGWTTHRVLPDHYGLAGVAVSARDPDEYGVLRTAGSGARGRGKTRLQVFFLRRPGGGGLQVRLDDRPALHIPTAGPRVEPGYATLVAYDGPHRLEVRPRGDGEVRVFGVAEDRDAPGVVVDTLGINGAQASYQLLWDGRTFGDHLRRRRPDLVVLAYGTNESRGRRPLPRYEADLRAVVRRVRTAVPGASCLLIGPSDNPRRRAGGYSPRPRTARINAVQRRVARESGCGFFDLFGFMGGDLSMLRWVAHRPRLGAHDHVHFTRRGYRRIGEALYEALMRGYGAVSLRDT